MLVRVGHLWRMAKMVNGLLNQLPEHERMPDLLIPLENVRASVDHVTI
jgi:hypothetical protein